MNNIFAKLFGFILNVAHVLFLIFMFCWFFMGLGSEFASGRESIVIGIMMLISYIFTMGALTTFVSIRQNLSEINEKLSAFDKFASNKNKEPKL